MVITMKKSVSKLMDLDIDEVSLVDRGANQHSLVAFSKSLTEADSSEESMSDTIAVFSETGDPVDLDSLYDGAVVYDAEGNELVYVLDPEEEDEAVEAEAALAGVGKSLSASILEDFSKAVTEKDREAVIAKAMDEVSKAQEVAAQAIAYAEAERDARLTDAFISKAAEYNLPVSPEVFGPILKSIAETLDEEQLEVLDSIFNAVGDALFNEIGYVGESSNSSVLDQVNAMADEFVGKADTTHAQALTALFEQNPAAYDAYISETGR
jgi:hypothetical protein